MLHEFLHIKTQLDYCKSPITSITISVPFCGDSVLVLTSCDMKMGFKKGLLAIINTIIAIKVSADVSCLLAPSLGGKEVKSAARGHAMRDVHPTVLLNLRPATLPRVRHRWSQGQGDSMGLARQHLAKSILSSPLRAVLSQIGRHSSRCFLQACPDTSFHLCQPLPNKL